MSLYPENVSKYNIVKVSKKKKKRNQLMTGEWRMDDWITNGIYGENNKFYRFMVMDNNSGLPERSNKFDRNFNFTSVYVFHNMYHSKLNWQIIISQTKIFDIFPRSIEISTISKILSTNCNRYTFGYIPKVDLRLNRLYFKISNSNKKRLSRNLQLWLS